LQSLRSVPEPIGQQGRWLDFIEEFNFVVLHRSRSKHNNADALSRRPDDRAVQARMTSAAVHTTQEESTSPVEMDNDNWSSTELAQAQASDPSFGHIYMLRMESEQRPPLEQVLTDSDEAKAYWNEWNFLVLRENVLYRRFVYSEGNTVRLAYS
jgi:hypothetical protein